MKNSMIIPGLRILRLTLYRIRQIIIAYTYMINFQFILR